MDKQIDDVSINRLIQERFQIEQWINTALDYQHNLELVYGKNNSFLDPSRSYIRRLELRLDRLDSVIEDLGVF